MKKTLQDQYLLIKEGKGHKGVFLTEAKRQFPNIIRNAATFDEAVASLKTKNIISENVLMVMPAVMNRPKKESYETAFEAFLAEAKKKKNEDEKVKAEEKKVSKPVEEDLSHNYDNSNDKNPDNMIFDQIMTGYYAEMKDPKNADKTMQELKDIVFKNLAKDPIHYTKDGQFGVKGLGYTMDAPGLGEPKEPKGKYKSSGYGDLNEGIFDKFKSKPLGDVEGAKKQALKIFRVWLKKNAGLANPEIMADDQVIDQIKAFAKRNPSNLVHRLWNQEKHLFEADNAVKYHDGDEDEEEVKDVRDYSWTKGFTEEENKLREVIREIISKELEEAGRGFATMGTINTKSSAGGGRRFTPSQFPLPQNIKKSFGEHIVYNPNSQTLYISDILYNNLIKGYGDDPTLKSLIRDIPKMVRQILNKTDSYGLTTELPTKKFRVYHPLNMKVEKAKADEFNKAGDKQYWAEGDFLIPNLNVMEEETMKFLKESVEKEIAEINKMAEYEVLESKLQKLADAIEKRQSQLGKLDEDEDMKALTDKNKIKDLQKDIKTLEKTKAKLEKMMSKHKGKVKKTEVIDEDEDGYVEDADERQDDGQSIDSIVSTYTNLSSDEDDDLKDYLEDREYNS
jgi:hypothetical protein